MLWTVAEHTPNEADAAKHLGIGVSSLKTLCRGVNIKWPGRKIRSFKSMINSKYVSAEHASKIKFLLRSAPWHEFRFDEQTQKELFKIRRQMYKKHYAAKLESNLDNK
jgi:hypothetical protein